MKKIIITTFFKAENYGAALQTYSLQEVIRGQGYDVEILNYRDSAIENSYKIYNIRRENCLLTIYAFLGMILFYRKRRVRHNKFLEFQEKFMRIGEEEYWSSEEILDNPPEADIYITGSDQVWNSSITKGISDIYTLNFGIEKICRIAYAASMGTRGFNLGEGKKVGEKISKINAVSVREDTAKSALEPFLEGKIIEVTLDPVMLRMKQEWETDITEFDRRQEKYILAYRIGENAAYWEIVNVLSKETGLKVIHFENWNKYNNPLRSEFTAGPLEFVSLIKNAEYVVTTSFHGTVFSIIFQKKFWAIPCMPHETRIVNLLEKLHISERVVYSLEEFEKKDYDEEINYEKADVILNVEREKSMRWLRMAMEDALHT